MKKNLLFKLSLFAFITIFTGVFNESKAQVVFSQQKEKKSNPDVFFPNRKKTSPVIRRRTSPIIVGNGNNLPPGQGKKIYGDKSARDYAPGHQKKNKYYKNDGRYKNGKHHNGNEHGDDDNGNKGHHNNDHDD